MVDVQVATDGKVPARAAGYAQEKIGALLHLAPGPVLSARVRMSRHGDPAVPHPVHAQANLDVNGRLVRAQAAGESPHEAVDRLEARLRRRLERIGENWEDRRGGMPSAQPHEWRHESEVTHRHAWYPRPAEEREIVRRKSYTLPRCSVDDAALDLGLLDYDFHLFTEAGTGQDSVLYRAGPTGFRLAQPTPAESRELAPHLLDLTISGQPAPVLTTAEAVDRLNVLDLPFLYFLDAEQQRGAVLYHRYDGHYGLLTPAE
jgi:ribosome-associated translation inhibitor RaiA